jgi:hypothetical protein
LNHRIFNTSIFHYQPRLYSKNGCAFCTTALIAISGELDPMPHTGFPRRNYGCCRSRLGLSEHRSLPGAVEIIQRDKKAWCIETKLPLPS